MVRRIEALSDRLHGLLLLLRYNIPLALASAGGLSNVLRRCVNELSRAGLEDRCSAVDVSHEGVGAGYCHVCGPERHHKLGRRRIDLL